jgi:hypothetical protein
MAVSRAQLDASFTDALKKLDAFIRDNFTIEEIYAAR